jgi:fumarylacetoacetate (FAA) hydrolase
MKLASLPGRGRDGRLVVVSEDLLRCTPAPAVADTLQQALERWERAAPVLERLAEQLEAGQAQEAQDFDITKVLAPLPRCYQFLDGSAYLTHERLVRIVRGSELPAGFHEAPLMYQGVSDAFIAPAAAIEIGDVGWGWDLESEIAVIVDDVPQGVDRDDALAHIRLVVLLNDLSLRNVMVGELSRGFGFVLSKPRSALSPLAVTPAQLGAAWRDGKVHGRLVSRVNGIEIGAPDPGRDMRFDYAELVTYAAKTRPLAAGSIIGGGVVENGDPAVGFASLERKRAAETAAGGPAATRFLEPGDRVEIEFVDAAGRSPFGRIDQRVAAA